MLIDPPGVDAGPVTLALRGGSSNCHGVLLLSATPYRLYSTRQEEAAGASHHQDFFELIRFLFGPESRQPKEIERDVSRFRRHDACEGNPRFQGARGSSRAKFNGVFDA